MKYALDEFSSADCEVREKTVSLRIHIFAGGWCKWGPKVFRVQYYPEVIFQNY